jgi:hypothetical protein
MSLTHMSRFFGLDAHNAHVQARHETNDITRRGAAVLADVLTDADALTDVPCSHFLVG